MRPAITLRDYQTAAVESVLEALQAGNARPLVSLPTGTGKSVVIAEIVRRLDTEALVLCPRAELVEQNAAKLEGVGVAASVWCAALGRKQVGQVTVASTMSALRAKHLEPKLVVVDEAHLLGDRTAARRLVDGYGCAVIGLTATPHRHMDGPIYGKGRMFPSLTYCMDIKDAIEAGHLAPVKSHCPAVALDARQFRVRNGEFDAEQMSPRVRELFSKHLGTIVAASGRRKACLVFVPTVDAVESVSRTLVAHGLTAAGITGETPATRRAYLIQQFRAGSLRYLVSCETLTTGFDAPIVDCVILARATMSPVLYEQMIGRGLRTAPGKVDCLVLDLAGNIERHGPLDTISVRERGQIAAGEALPPAMVVCPSCGTPQRATRAEKCACGAWLPRNAAFERDASTAALLSGEPAKYKVNGWSLSKGVTKAGCPCVIIDYKVTGRSVRQYIMPGAEGYAGKQADLWSRTYTGATCDTAAELYDRLVRVQAPTSVTIKLKGSYTNVLGVELAAPVETKTDDIFAGFWS